MAGSDENAWGVPLTLSSQQVSELVQFRAECRKRGVPAPDAVTGLKYVMARNGDVAAACKSHAETVAWATTSGFSACLSDSTKLSSIPVQCESLLLQRWPQHYLGRDADNRPVVFEHVGSFVPDDFARKAKLSAEEMCTYYVKHLTLQSALLREASAQEGRLVSRLVHIFDASGVSLRAHLSACARDTFHRVAAAADAHFPETLGVLLIINAGGPFPALWAVGKTFVDERTRSKIEVFPSAPAGSNFFAPGGWPARLRQLMGGSFPEMLYPNATIPAVKDAPWEQPLWKLLGYGGPAPPRRHIAPPRHAPASPPATPVSKPPVKASAGKAGAGQQAAGAPPVAPPARKQQPSQREEMTSFKETPRAGGGAAVVSFEAAQVLPPAPRNQHRASDKPPPGRPGPPATASKASRAIWELAASHVAAAGVSTSAGGQNVGSSRVPGREAPAGGDGGGATRDDVVRWVEQSAGHAPPPPHSRPPSSLGGRDGPDTPVRRMNGHSHRGVGQAREHGARSGGTTSGGARTWLDDSAFDSPSVGGELPMVGHTTLYGSSAWAGPSAGSYEHLVSPDVVWDAVVDVAHALDLFGPEDGAAFDGTDASRHDIVDAAIRAAASDGWSCSVCGKRFAFTDVALAQACEARHAAAEGKVPPAHAGSPAARARALNTIMASPVRSRGDSGGWDESPSRGGDVSTTPERGAGPHASKWGGSPRDAAQAAATAAAMAANWPPDEAASPWQPVVALDAADPRQRPVEQPASRSGFGGSAPLGRVYTSADARARMGGSSGRGCTVPVPGQCAIQ